MNDKKRTAIGVAILVVLIMLTVGAASFTGYYIYDHFRPINISGEGVQGYVSLKFITTEVSHPVNKTG